MMHEAQQAIIMPGLRRHTRSCHDAIIMPPCHHASVARQASRTRGDSERRRRRRRFFSLTWPLSHKHAHTHAFTRARTHTNTHARARTHGSVLSFDMRQRTRRWQATGSDSQPEPCLPPPRQCLTPPPPPPLPCLTLSLANFISKPNSVIC